MKTQKLHITCYIKSFFALSLIGFMVSCATTPGPNSAAQLRGNKPITAKWTKIVRGANACPLTAQAVGQGNNPPVRAKEPLTDLSVIASDDKRVTYNQLAAYVPHANYGFTTLGDLRKANKHVLIVRDPLPNNPYHCLLSVITPKEFVSRTNCR